LLPLELEELRELLPLELRLELLLELRLLLKPELREEDEE
jgi:hypothetical protein